MWVRTAVVFVVVVGLSLASEPKLLSKCEVAFNRCKYDCTQKYPVDEAKRKGCTMRCNVDRILCDSKRAVKEAGRKVKDFLEGFTE